MTPDQRAALRKLLAEATCAPPWQVSGVRQQIIEKLSADHVRIHQLHLVGPDAGDAVAAFWYDPRDGAGYTDARLCAGAVSALPALLDALDAQDALLKEARAVLACPPREELARALFEHRIWVGAWEWANEVEREAYRHDADVIRAIAELLAERKP
jgi:hypothetical protein